MGSKRLPHKVLADVHGVPLVLHVCSRVEKARGIDAVFVATDSDEIASVVDAAGVAVIRTSGDVETGTDRVAEAIASLNADIVLNVQADNGDLQVEVIERIVERLADNQVQVVTAVAPFPADRSPDDPSIVKAVVDRHGRAIYFSRSAIPHGGPWLQHIGVYGFRRDALEQFSAWGRGVLEQSEQLEQLRLIENGLLIHAVSVERGSIGVDTEADLKRLLSSISDFSKNNRGCHA
jgi:3-deoxy-manno-octulosonate cytidylyltransferase (CMP-KDO synthetase)